jgi:hypothetical protein
MKTPRVLILLMGAHLASGCEIVFPLVDPTSTATFFEGCFSGPITDPPGQGAVTLVLEAGEGLTMTGCLISDSGMNAPLSGSTIAATPTEATLTVVTPNASFNYVATREPSGAENATRLSLVLQGGSANPPFISAAVLNRCVTDLTCASTSMPQPFVPGDLP